MKRGRRINYFYLVCSLVFGLLCLSFFKQSYTEHVLARTEGLEVKAKIARIQKFCKRTNNRIDVIYQKKTYSVSISRTQCLKGTYRTGDDINLIYVDRFDSLFIKKDTSGFNYILSIVFLVLPIAFFVEAIKKRR